MSKTDTVRARINPKLKQEVETILESLGISTSQAINMFFSQVILRNGIPFDVSIPNKETEDTFKNTDNGKEIHKFSSVEEMFNDLES